MPLLGTPGSPQPRSHHADPKRTEPGVGGPAWDFSCVRSPPVTRGVYADPIESHTPGRAVRVSGEIICQRAWCEFVNIYEFTSSNRAASGGGRGAWVSQTTMNIYRKAPTCWRLVFVLRKGPLAQEDGDGGHKAEERDLVPHPTPQWQHPPKGWRLSPFCPREPPETRGQHPSMHQSHHPARGCHSRVPCFVLVKRKNKMETPVAGATDTVTSYPCRGKWTRVQERPHMPPRPWGHQSPECDKGGTGWLR